MTADTDVDALVSAMPTAVERGTLTAQEGVTPLGAVAAFRAIDAAAKDIAKVVEKHRTSLLWIAPSEPLSSARVIGQRLDSELARHSSNLDKVSGALREQQAPAVGPMVLGLQLALSALPLLSSLLATDTTIRGGPVSTTFRSVAASIAAAVGRKVIISDATSTVDDKLLERVDELAAFRDRVVYELTEYRRHHQGGATGLAAANAALAAEKAVLDGWLKTAPTPEAAELIRKEVRPRIVAAATEVAEREAQLAPIDLIEQVIAEVNGFLAALATVDGQNLLLRASAWRAFEADGENSRVLVLETSYTAGETVYSKRFLWEKATHLGVATVTWLLINPSGALVASGVQHGYRAVTTGLRDTEIRWPA